MKLSKKSAVQTEVDAAYLYDQLALSETENSIAEIYRQMAAIEHSHAAGMLKEASLPQPSWRARMLNRVGKIFGYEYVLDALMQTEKALACGIVSRKNNNLFRFRGQKIIMSAFCKTSFNQKQKSAVKN